MMFSGLLANREPYRKILVLAGFALFFVVLFTLIGGLCCSFFFGINPISNPDLLNNTADPDVVNVLKLMQSFSALGLFIIPVIAAAFLFDTKPADWLKLNKPPLLITCLLVLLTIVVSGPLINWLNEINQHLSLPAFLKCLEDWMKNAEDRTGELTKVFLDTDGYAGLGINLIVLALLPAIGEELLFRGAVQRLLTELTRNKHMGIVLSAIAFSALHMQFYGFLPRMMLGIYFGYLVLWSGTLWPAIIGHFINNAMAVMLFYMKKKEVLSFDPDNIGTNQGEEMILLTGILLTIAFIWINYGMEMRKKNPAY